MKIIKSPVKFKSGIVGVGKMVGNQRCHLVSSLVHIYWSMVTCKMAAPVTRTTLRTTGPEPADSR